MNSATPDLPELRGFTVTGTRTTEQIADALQEVIVRGRLAPGARIRESALAAQLGVSRNTVREAVLMLQRTGLVVLETNRGAIVRPLDSAHVADLYHAREALECAGATAAGDPDLRGVQRALRTLERSARRGAVADTVQADLSFHGAIVALYGSPRLDRVFEELRSELRFYLATISVAHHETETPEELIEQHAVVVRALSDGDRDMAAELLRAHIRLNAGQILALLTGEEGADGPR